MHFGWKVTGTMLKSLCIPLGWGRGCVMEMGPTRWPSL